LQFRLGIFLEFTESNRRVFQDTSAQGAGYYHAFHFNDSSVYIGAL